MTRTTTRKVRLTGAGFVAAAVVATSAATAFAAAGEPGTPGKDVTIGLDNDTASNPFIQPPGVTAPQHMNDTDLLFGRGNADLLVGNKGGDTLLGGTGPDILVGGPDRGSDRRDDVLVSDQGDDVAIWSPGDGNDIVDGNDGTDTLIVGPVLTTIGGGLRLDTWTLNRAIPKVDLAGATNQSCELVPVPDSEHLGVQYLLRLNVEGVLQNTLRLKEMEAVVCPGPYAGTARVADLTPGKPSFSTVPLSAVRGLAGVIVAPLR
jgi:RTX calcium-binding nonapeptide repeat (4 copies)